MTRHAAVLDGTGMARQIKAELGDRVRSLTEAGRRPGLGTILVGDDAPSRVYVDAKHRDCADTGIHSTRIQLPWSSSQAEILAEVERLNADDSCTGFIIQLPLPTHVDMHALLASVDPAKDADGLHPVSLGHLVLGMPGPAPCTPRAIIELLRRYDIP